MKKYVFKPYSKLFPTLFENEKKRIQSHTKQPMTIEHIGSTSIPDLGGKGIIDIGIAVEKETMDLICKELQSLGYEFRPSFSTAKRYYFMIYLPDTEEGKRRYHLHLTYPENSEWFDFLAFRDYLRDHPEEAKEYARIKETAAFEANENGDYYRKMKEPIFKKIHTLSSKPIFRKLREGDIEALGDLYFPWSTREETILKWTRYFKEQSDGIRISTIVQERDKISGYGHLLLNSLYPPFSNDHIPEIHDIWIYEDARKKGLGTLLIAHLENLAKEYGADEVGIGVGLYKDYGRAQRLYFRLGYEPTGGGITYKGVPVIPGDQYPIDDDLILWLTKRLSKAST
jgi:GrpB-like predicted nucleotidyltransferase (UPF0157 family)/GNAT superfamily N-acetyltransferase